MSQMGEGWRVEKTVRNHSITLEKEPFGGHSQLNSRPAASGAKRPFALLAERYWLDLGEAHQRHELAEGEVEADNGG
jgi:hypothetical protein